MKFFSKLISAVMALGLTTIIVLNTTVVCYAGLVDYRYATAFGNDNTEEVFYLWHKVTGNAQKPLYEYLSDGDNLDNQYTRKDNKKTFRVMLVQNYRPETSLATDIALITVMGPLGIAMDYAINQLMGTSYLYYVADWTRIVYETSDNVGKSTAAVSGNKEIDINSDTFITRGAVRSFICDYDRKWIDGGGDHTGHLATEYVGTHRYHFYYPDEDDVNPKYTLTYTEGRSFSNLGAYDEAGNPWAGDKSGFGNISKNNDKAYYTGLDNGKFIQTWAVVQKGNGKMRILPYDYDGPDYTLGFRNEKDAGLCAAKYKDEQFEEFILYVGEECSSDMIESMNGNNKKGSLSAGGYRTITRATMLKKDEEFTIESDAVLFVDSLLILRGTINNAGIIIVEEGGCIVSWNNNNGTIINKNGDIIVRKNAGLFVHELQAENGLLQLYNPLYAKKATYSSGVIDKRPSGIASSDELENYKFIKIEKYVVDGKYVGYDLSFDASKFKLSGSGDVKIDKSVLQYEYGEPKN